MKQYFDLHIHSDRSGDSVISPKSILVKAREYGLSGIAVTDHDELTIIRSPYPDLIIVPGMEITVKDLNVHVLALGITEAVRTDLSLLETIDMIHDLDGIAGAPHPFSGKEGFPGMGDLVYEIDTLDAIEVTSPRPHVDNLLARKASLTMGLARIGGSDAHHPDEIASGLTMVRENVESVDDLMMLVKKRRTDGILRKA
ncbi:MAG: PHP domain-containing protein [Thermoplasmatota archaeon]